MSDLSDLLKAASESMASQIREAYERGRRDERERILRLASDDDVAGTSFAEPRVVTKMRAAHGTIRPLVQQVLRSEPGLTKHEVGARVVQLNPEVSALSAANELQRNDIKNRNGRRLYRRKGDRWYVVEEEPLQDTAGIAENDHPPHMNGAEAPG
jgi:hypothetical protein